jgi:hypothetical protein
LTDFFYFIYNKIILYKIFFKGKAVMISIGIGEIQKNISIFKNITEEIKIVDKRKKETLAIIYPVKQKVTKSVIKKLAGKYKNKIKKTNLSLEEIKELAIKEAMKEKYGLSS